MLQALLQHEVPVSGANGHCLFPWCQLFPVIMALKYDIHMKGSSQLF
ncbi:hypothetical Protein YC6258_03895 [Gynuella sunshinyii YC6258]|uniref:Uncharacterized protein n=1 Tax=Gynuella sunshinyii YC6258 TaxID=1445510 RepID=A0A0C5VNP0_9GAMM|nr:hypothetical Protein YC6258_03895 [Gynuella sunshinyii YC6258]